MPRLSPAVQTAPCQPCTPNRQFHHESEQQPGQLTPEIVRLLLHKSPHVAAVWQPGTAAAAAVTRELYLGAIATGLHAQLHLFTTVLSVLPPSFSMAAAVSAPTGGTGDPVCGE